ncbi:MAG: hypothetical protein JW913_09560 [Chitinispirillaceae bacterium]|nr:hypothetical protein [Chitinispirillaceae bacterium]
MQRRGHEISDRLGYTEGSADVGPQTDGVRQVWTGNRSQAERVIHAGLIAVGSLSYATTAAIELAMPRMSKSQSPVSDTRLHRYAFYLHAGLMAANIALGFVESSALSSGNHDLVTGAGIAHIVVGFSVPVVMLGAGAIFSLPNEY